MCAQSSRPSRTNQIAWIGLALGPTLAVLAYTLLPQAGQALAGEADTGLSHQARATAGIAVLMAIWWLTETIPLSATALLPLVLFPITGAVDIKTAAAPYANTVIFLFMGGFILGLGMQRWGLHKRIALITVLIVGTTPKRLIAGFMLAAAMLSMWVSNTAAAIMMLPIATSIVDLIRSRRDTQGKPDPILDNFATALLLAIAYACSIGGIGTLIGTPPNTILAGFVRDNMGGEISMQRWLMFSLPLVGISLPIAWAYLVFIATPVRLDALPGGRALIAGELKARGKPMRGEWVVAIVFCCAVFLWIARPTLIKFGQAHDLTLLTSLNDASIAIAAAVALFIIPVKPRERIFAMDWATAEKLPWGILILFGGGLSLANAITVTGLDTFLGQQFASLQGVPTWVLIAAVVTTILFLTELTSNTAVINAMLPVLAAAAPVLGIDPIMLLVPATIAASMAFMLPVATPPNAIVYSSGHIPLQRMARTGLGLNLGSIIIITAITLVFKDFLLDLISVHP